jgi:hypothetical protein
VAVDGWAVDLWTWVSGLESWVVGLCIGWIARVMGAIRKNSCQGERLPVTSEHCISNEKKEKCMTR